VFANSARLKMDALFSVAIFFILIIWCFIAGFSEKLGANILSKTEDQVDKK